MKEGEVKFTPGPWRIFGESCTGEIDIVGPLHTASSEWEDDGGIYHQWIAGAYLGLEEAEANARLIAAAPAMYEVLEWVANQLIPALVPPPADDFSIMPLADLERWAINTRQTREQIRGWYTAVLEPLLAAARGES